MAMEELADHVNSDPSVQFSSGEIQAALELMQDANQVMVSENVIFLI